MLRINIKYNHRAPAQKTLKTGNVTIPDQALTVRQILQRYVNGQSVPDLSNKLYYSQDIYVPDPAHFDLSEMQEIKESLQSQIDLYTDEINNFQSEQTTEALTETPQTPENQDVNP